MPAPAVHRLRGGFLLPLPRQDSSPPHHLPSPALDLLPVHGQGQQGGQPPASSSAAGVVGGEVAPRGGAPVRDARPHRQAHRYMATRLALHVVNHNSSNARGAP